jgi:hypothetical protein
MVLVAGGEVVVATGAVVVEGGVVTVGVTGGAVVNTGVVLAGVVVGGDDVVVFVAWLQPNSPANNITPISNIWIALDTLFFTRYSILELVFLSVDNITEKESYSHRYLLFLARQLPGASLPAEKEVKKGQKNSVVFNKTRYHWTI